MLAGLEPCEDLRVHVDSEVLLLDELLVPLGDLLVDPVLERLADDGVDEVGDVGPGQLLHLSRLHGQRLLYCWVALGVMEHGSRAESLEVRHLDGLHLRRLDGSPPAGSQVSQVEDGHRLVAGQEDAAVEG